MAVYTVRSGDTLSAIAAASGVSLAALIAANPQIGNPNLIFPGQNVTVPTTTTPRFNDPLSEDLRDPDSPSFDPFTPPPPPVQPPTTLPPPLSPGGSTTPPPSGAAPPTGSPTPTPTLTPVPVTIPSPEEVAAGEFGLIEFNLLTADGPVTIPIFFPKLVWAAIMASPLASKYGFDVGVTQVPIGQSKNFIADAANFLSGNPQVLAELTQKLESLALFDELTPNAGDVPVVTPEMAATGIAWVIDPVTGQPQLIDTMPFFGPPVSAFQFVPDDPNTPFGGGAWKLIQDPALVGKSIFEGVPKSVEPWLQAALDAGGDTSGIPEGPARAWVDFIIGQAENTSSRPPTELPFGFGLPDFGAGLGAEIPEQPPVSSPADGDGTGSGGGTGDDGPPPTPTPRTVIDDDDVPDDEIVVPPIDIGRNAPLPPRERGEGFGDPENPFFDPDNPEFLNRIQEPVITPPSHKTPFDPTDPINRFLKEPQILPPPPPSDPTDPILREFGLD